MGINFPPSPTIGTLWPNPATAGVPQYTWNGTVWTTVLAPPAFYAQDSAPVGAPVNALWWDTDSGILFINYKDVSTTQWVATSSVPAVDTSNFATQTSRLRNRIVNGAMQISQEWGNTLSGPTATLSFYPADQWVASSSTSPGTVSVQRVQSVTPRGSQDRLRLVVAAAKTTLTAGDYLMFYQGIEGLQVADFRWGTAQAKQVILRFGFKGPAGIYSTRISNGANNRAYVANFTIAAVQANTDTEQVVIIPGDTTGTWATNETVGAAVGVALAAGTNYQGIVGWQAGNIISTSTNTNGMAATNNTFELFDVGLYLDVDSVGVPPKWELPAYDDELRRCQRYWQKLGGGVYSDLLFGAYGTTGSNIGQGYAFPVEMRTIPTATVAGTWIVNGCAQPIIAGTSAKVVGVMATMSASQTAYFLTADGNCFIRLVARM